MKKLLSIFVAINIMLICVACGNNSAPTDANVSDNAGVTETTESFLDTKEASLKYIGIEKAKKALCDDYENVYLLKFDFSNKTSEPKQCQNIFSIKAFQNGVQLSESSSFYSDKGGTQYELLSNYYLEVMDGGIVSLACKYVINDMADITVIIEDDNKNTAKFDISAEEIQSLTVDVSPETIKELLQGSWSLANNVVTFENDTIKFSEELKGSYTISVEDSTVDATFAATDGNVSIHMPFEYENGTLRLYNNNNEELTKQ